MAALQLATWLGVYFCDTIEHILFYQEVKIMDHIPTHFLLCRHAVGDSGKRYSMYCDIIKKMKNDRLKIRVFGTRFWPGHFDKSYIRYVKSFRVSIIPRAQHHVMYL